MDICVKLLFRGAQYEEPTFIQHLSNSSGGISVNKLM